MNLDKHILDMRDKSFGQLQGLAAGITTGLTSGPEETRFIESLPIEKWREAHARFMTARLVLSMRTHEGRAWEDIVSWLQHDINDQIRFHRGQATASLASPSGLTTAAVRADLIVSIQQALEALKE